MIKGLRRFEQEIKKLGPSFRIPFLSDELIFINDLDILQQLLSSTDPGHLNKPKFIYDVTFTEILRNGLLASEVATWAPHRKILNSAFTYKALNTYLKYIQNGAEAMAGKAMLAAINSPNQTIDMPKFREFMIPEAVKIITRKHKNDFKVTSS